jgi:hypothetical protein
MPRKNDEPLSRAKKGVSVEESSSVMEEIPQVETWTVPASEMTGEIVATVETWITPGEIVATVETWTTPGEIVATVEAWTTPASEMPGEIVATVETWTTPARR